MAWADIKDKSGRKLGAIRYESESEIRERNERASERAKRQIESNRKSIAATLAQSRLWEEAKKSIPKSKHAEYERECKKYNDRASTSYKVEKIASVCLKIFKIITIVALIVLVLSVCIESVSSTSQIMQRLLKLFKTSEYLLAIGIVGLIVSKAVEFISSKSADAAYSKEEKLVYKYAVKTKEYERACEKEVESKKSLFRTRTLYLTLLIITISGGASFLIWLSTTYLIGTVNVKVAGLLAIPLIAGIIAAVIVGNKSNRAKFAYKTAYDEKEGIAKRYLSR